MPRQDLVPHQPPLPLLLRQRTVRRQRSRDRHRATRAARPPDPGPRHLGRAAVRPPGRRRPRRRRPRAHPDRRPPAGHRPERPRHRRGVPVPARCARRGPAGPPRPASLVGQAVPVRAQARPGPAPAGRVAGAALRAPAPDRGRARGGTGGRRVRRQPGDDARPRAERPWRPAPGHPRRRRQRHPPRRAGRRRDRVPGPGVGLAVPQPAARPARRRPSRPRGPAGVRRVPLRRRPRRRDPPARRPGLAARRPRHPGAGAPPGPAGRPCGSSACKPGTC